MKAVTLVFAAMIGAAAFLPQNAATSSAAVQAPTAQDVIDRIKAHVGIPWVAETVDTFKAGDPKTPVRGIAVTMMATYAVLQRAAANGQNLIITHEPTFYDHLDKASEVPQGEQDAVLAEKRAFIETHHLVVWRFHDHLHRMHVDGIQLGNVHTLGWEKFQDPANQYLFTIPETTLGELALELQKKLGVSAMRVVGNREMKVTRVAFSPGAAGSKNEIRALEMPDIQALIVGETREWETVEYATDAVSQGRHKALIVLSHIPSEQQGMAECAKWLKTFVTEVPVEFVPAPDPFKEGALLEKR
jgi:putative NIF3 family GTP cyclohydrolase 1 type 2